MEYRKELSEKSKKLIASRFKSDIHNTSTGYYKKEVIFPITPKPNELKQKTKEFIPKYKEIKPYEMRINHLLSDQQKHDSSIMKKLIIIPNKKNPELEAYRNRAKTIKDHCYDERGNFSSRKMHILDYSGLEYMNKTTNNHSNSKSIKDKRKLNRSFYLHKIPKTVNIYLNDNENYNERHSTINFNEDKKKDKDKTIKRIYLKHNNKFNINSRNRNKINMTNSLSGISDEGHNSINDIKCKGKKVLKISTDMNLTDVNINKSINNNNILNTSNYSPVKRNIINQKTHFHPKELNKVFYTQTNNPVKSNRMNKNDRDNEEKEYFYIEIKNFEPLNKKASLNDEKKIKEIFYKNGLHIYDFNEDGMNLLSTEKKMEAKLRKNKKDENFDKNYRKAIKELNKINIVINKKEILNKKGFENKALHKKRQGTPGAVLYKNKETKDTNTKLNTGFGFKRDKNIQPQNNKNYKNHYNYKMTYFNHNKK